MQFQASQTGLLSFLTTLFHQRHSLICHVGVGLVHLSESFFKSVAWIWFTVLNAKAESLQSTCEKGFQWHGPPASVETNSLVLNVLVTKKFHVSCQLMCLTCLCETGILHMSRLLFIQLWWEHPFYGRQERLELWEERGLTDFQRGFAIVANFPHNSMNETVTWSLQLGCCEVFCRLWRTISPMLVFQFTSHSVGVGVLGRRSLIWWSILQIDLQMGRSWSWSCAISNGQTDFTI